MKNIWNTWNEKTKGKGTIIVAAVVFLGLFLAIVCRNPLYGTYTPGKLLYLSPLSAAHKTLYEESFTEIKVSGKEFVVTQGGENFVVEQPVYQTEEMTEARAQEFQQALQNKESGIVFDSAKKIHFVNQEDGKISEYLLIELDDSMWFVKYYMVAGRMDIWHIMEIEK